VPLPDPPTAEELAAETDPKFNPDYAEKLEHAATKAHARLSPSGAHRWMACPGSMKLEAPFPDTSSIYSDEGTAAHQLMEWCLTTGQDASAYAGRLIEIEDSGRKFEVDEDMVAGIQMYCDLVRGLGGEMMVEQTVDISRFLEQPDAFGTADTLVVVGKTLYVIDLKYGRRRVDAEENKQLMLYGLGALDVVSLAYDIEKVVLMIVQPKLDAVSEFELPVEDLLHFATTARVSAKVAVAQFEGKAQPVLVPGESQCQWCKAKSVCPALAAETRAVVSPSATAEDFSDLTVESVVVDEAATDDYLSYAMDKADLIEGWVKSVRAEVERRLVAGTPVPGYKLVEGKRGHRKWINPDEAELQMKSMRLKQDEMYDLSLISPTTAEKLRKAGRIGDRQWKKLEAQYAQSQGKASVAPEDDKRPAITVAATADDFTAIDDGSDLA
jgi:hypothetical protein